MASGSRLWASGGAIEKGRMGEHTAFECVE